MRWNRSCWVAALILMTVACGCRKRSRHHTVVSDDDIFTTDDFPGAPVQDGNVADDLRAFSNAGEYCQQPKVFFNGDRAQAIVMYATVGSGMMDPTHIYAHYYDGSTWTPPVALEAADVDWFGGGSAQHAAFLNTADHPDASARDRDGDAILTWSALDQDGDGGATADGLNVCIFATYFDASEAGDPGMRYGFQELGARLNSRDGADEHAGTAGIVSDGLCGEHGFAPVGNRFTYRYGDDTSGIVVFWNQLEDNDAALAGTEDASTCYVWFDLAAGSDPVQPLVPSSDVRLPILGFGAADSGAESEETQVDREYRVYNNTLFFRVASDDDPLSGPSNFPPTSLSVPYGNSMGSEDDVTLQYVAFDLAAGSFAGPFNASTGPRDSTDATESNADFIYSNLSAILVVGDTPSLYGSDEGLAELLFVFVELAADTDAVTVFGSAALGDGRLVVSGIDEITGLLHSSAAVNADDPAFRDTVEQGTVSTRIGRNGDYIWLVWIQPDGTGLSVDNALFAAQCVTTRPDEDGNFTLSPVATVTSLPSRLDFEEDTFGVEWFQFQDGLGYVCGVQSDPDVMNVFFNHGNAVAVPVFMARLTADPSLTPAPSAIATTFEVFEGPSDIQSPNSVNDDHLNFNAVDSGEGGNVLAVFRQDIGGLATDDVRLFARRTGLGAGKVEIDSFSAVRQVPAQQIRLISTPVGENVGRFDPVNMEDSEDRPHPASLVHVLFFEDRYAHGTGTGAALRARVFDAQDDAIALGDTFTPAAGVGFEVPFELEIPFLDPDTTDSPAILGAGTEATTVGLWFREEGHVYYQEFDDDDMSWHTEDGVSNPILVDDDSPVEVAFVQLYLFPCTCRTLHGATTFWIKDLDGSGNDARLQVRVRD